MQVMSEDVDKKEHSKHSPRLTEGGCCPVALPTRTTEADRTWSGMNRIYNMLFSWSFRSSYIPTSWLSSIC